MSPFCVGTVLEPETVVAAFDAGINFFFVTADMHWPLYQGVRRGLEMLLARGGGIRDDIVVAGVSYATQPEFCSMPFRELVDNVAGLDRLDVLIAGGAYGYELDRRISVYENHRSRRYLGSQAFGATFHDRPAAVQFLMSDRIDLCFIRYNSSHTGARQDVFPQVTSRRRPLFNFTSTQGYVRPERFDALDLDAGAWRPEITDHYRFVLSSSEIDGILCSLRDAAQVRALADALELGPLDDDEQEHLMALSSLAR